MNTITPEHNGSGLRIGIVQARFTNPIGAELVKACCSRLIKLGVKDSDITLATVPGALEVPLVLKSMADSGKFDALVAIGVVIRGETYHFELVSNEAAAGVSRVSLDHNIPIANAILTTENDAQALARMHNKGSEAAIVAVEMANLLKIQY
ncbi:6,7-dimethyl-8-ribityllumazine synthase [Snodgrassella alvi]|uniref:6,7-dimethyl-8-ribityllumazine synthase n=1 Tax=Snodgrassella alvi TaxID=1196083 RepID=UPI003D088F99